MEILVLEEIRDVTDRVNAAAKPGLSEPDVQTAKHHAMSTMEDECARQNVRCEVVALYSGAQYHLYKYKVYDDIRLVFSPELDIAFFGGEKENFEFPRYGLDVSFLRAYENGAPAKTKHYFKWSKQGVSAAELVFLSGHPAQSGRLLTLDQLAFLRDYQYPMLLASYQRRISTLQRYAAQSEENARQTELELFSEQSSYKAIFGTRSELKNPQIMLKKGAQEKRLREYVTNDPTCAKQYGDPWATIGKALEVQKAIYRPAYYLEDMAGFRGALALYARTIVRSAEEKQKPSSERIRGYQDSALPSLERQLFSTTAVSKPMEQALLAESLAEMQEELGLGNSAVKTALAGKTPEERAKEIVEGTHLDDVAVRKQLYQGGKNAVTGSNDPAIVMMRSVEPEMLAIRQRREDEIDAVVTTNAASIARIQLMQSASKVAPDATSTLRLSYGVMRGYDVNGSNVTWFTMFGGAYQVAAAHANNSPYRFPDTWMKSQSSVNLQTFLDTVSTADTLVGDSGSPVINKNAEVVGILLDGNAQSLSWDFLYDDKQGRAIATDSRAILEAIRKIYHADALADELTGEKAKSAKTPSKAPRPNTVRQHPSHE